MPDHKYGKVPRMFVAAPAIAPAAHLSSPRPVVPANSVRALVLGEGVNGLATALALRQQGWAVRVRGIKAPSTHSASWAGGGILCPLLPWDTVPALWDWLWPSMQAYPAWVDGLAALSGVDVELRTSGLIALDAPAHALAWCAHAGLAAHAATVPDPARAQQAVCLPTVQQVRNPRLLRALREAAERLGVGFGPPPTDEPIHATVIAAGAHSAQFATHWGVTLPVWPVRGQMLALRAGADAPTNVVVADGRYLIPRADGTVLVGSTVEEVGFDIGTTQDAASSLRDWASHRWPASAAWPQVGHWAGLRPASPDGIPWVGQIAPGVYVNSGQFRYGLTLAPHCAARLATQMTGHAVAGSLADPPSASLIAHAV